MFKKLFIAFSFIFMLAVVPAHAADKYEGYELPVDIQVNGTFIRCAKKPFMENNVTYIPLRAFADATCAQINWDEPTKTATMVKDGRRLEFCHLKKYCVVDGVKYPLTVINRDNLLFVPVRAISTALGYGVSWDDCYFTVKITAPNVTVPNHARDFSYTYDDILYLGKITMLESGSQGLKTKIGICNTVLNRVQSGSFPNTVKEVIYDKKYGTQFPPVFTELMNKTPSRECFIAAKCALNGVNLVGDSLYFISTKAAPSSWAHKNRKYYTTIGNMAFYL